MGGEGVHRVGVCRAPAPSGGDGRRGVRCHLAESRRGHTPMHSKRPGLWSARDVHDFSMGDLARSPWLCTTCPTGGSHHCIGQPPLHTSQALGERGIPAETLGRSAGAELEALLESGACVDDHAADQLVIFAAMARGESQLLMGEPTLHTLAAIAVAEQLTSAHFILRPVDGLTRMHCHGAGLTWGRGALPGQHHA